MQWMNKKGDLEFETVIKLLLALIILLVIIGLIFILKGKSFVIFDKIKSILRFGN